MKILYILVLSLLPTLILSNAAASGNSQNHEITDSVEALCIYQIQNGYPTVRFFSGNELKAGQAIMVEGYISGVVLLSNKFIEASVAGLPLKKLQIDTDVSHDLTGYKNIQPEELAAVFRNAGRFDFDLNRLKGKYAWFPRIPGDTICIQNQFSIILKGADQTLEVPVFHTGSVNLSTLSSKPEKAGYGMNFRYFGNNTAQFEMNDFEVRIKAIIEGIQTVESFVGDKLITSVNLLDYFGINNALTSDGRTEIWIYPDIFWKESIEELRTIARHETLHVLVDRTRLRKNPDLRELFADLRGFDAFSVERFALITTGFLPPDIRRTGNPDSIHILFAFINEKNFFKGMKGGHSQDSLDEFCVSFLHSLLFPEYLDRNLRKSLILPGGKTIILSPEEQESLLETYLITIEKMITATVKNSSDNTMETFLRDRLTKTRWLSDGRQKISPSKS
jgi:hypothetical protein